MAELAYVQNIWDNMKPNSPIYRLLLDNIELKSASNGTVVAHLKVDASHLNSKGGLHGVVSACIVDWAGGMAIASTGREKTGVSTDMHVTYVSSAKEGDTLEIEGKVNKVGRMLGFTAVEIRKVDGQGGAGTMVCAGTHTKYIKI